MAVYSREAPRESESGQWVACPRGESVSAEQGRYVRFRVLGYERSHLSGVTRPEGTGIVGDDEQRRPVPTVAGHGSHFTILRPVFNGPWSWILTI